jgi:hypothetical protein
VTGQKGIRILWSGRNGEQSCEVAECENDSCDGRHIGLRVQCSREGDTFAMRNQLGVCYNPLQVQKSTAVNFSLVQKFLDNCDYVVKVGPALRVYMSWLDFQPILTIPFPQSNFFRLSCL